MDATRYQKFLDELTATLGADQEVVGLVTLGSTADASKRDEYSDHDFWIVTKPASQSRYLDRYDWLPMPDQILLTVRHGQSYRAILFDNGHRAEYAVFDEHEARSGKIESFAVLIDRSGIAELAESIRRSTTEERAAFFDRPDRFENFCWLLWSAHGLAKRGEDLSAHRYVDMAVDRLLDMLVINGLKASDTLDPKRRLEKASPELAMGLQQLRRSDQAGAALILAEIAESELRQARPDLAWGVLDTIKKWINQ